MGLSYYLGAAIDLSSDLNPFEVMTQKVIEYDQHSVIFRPESAYRNAHKTKNHGAHFLKSVNDHALLSADIAIFYISSKTFSMGAALEIQERARMHEYHNRYHGGLRASGYAEKVEAYNPDKESPFKKTIVITDKAGLYMEVQKSKDLIVHLLDGKTLAEIDISKLIQKACVEEN